MGSTRRRAVGLTVVAVGLVALGGFLTHDSWLPPVQRAMTGTPYVETRAASLEVEASDGHAAPLDGAVATEAGAEPDSHADHAGHDHAGHSHGDHEPHEEGTVVELSGQALASLGLTGEGVRPVYLRDFTRRIAVPAVVVPKPGVTVMNVAAPLTGLVTEIEARPGRAVRPGDLLFRMRLTHEDVVRAQTEFLRTLGELDIEQQEVARLTPVVASGAVARSKLLEREYQRDRLEASLQAQREALRLHGLSTEQIARIAESRTLLRSVEVYAPQPGGDAKDSFRLSSEEMRPVSFQDEATDRPMVLTELLVHTGEAVETGGPLCTLADMSTLYIEADAFESDAAALTEAVRKNTAVDAAFETGEVVKGLTVDFIANRIDPAKRTLSAFIDLPNEYLGGQDGSGRPTANWKFRPGQRAEVLVPVGRFRNRFVVPVEAVAREGAERFVFIRHGDHFEQRPVQELYRDQFDVVLADDGSIHPGDRLAMKAARQLHLTLQNASGGGMDPHAGHNH